MFAMYVAFSLKFALKICATCNFAHFAIHISPKFDEIDSGIKKTGAHFIAVSQTQKNNLCAAP
jgi:hypothetical protein